MRKARLMIFALMASFALAIGGSAGAGSPSGSSDSSTNQTSCGDGVAVDNPAFDGNLLVVYAGANGVETCSDDGVPLDGRVIVSFEDEYVAADGDRDNPGDLQGWARVDSDGSVTCGNGDTDSSDGGGSQANCG